MTLLLIAQSDRDIVVVADTRMTSGLGVSFDLLPKIFTAPVRLASVDNGEVRRRVCSDVGFAFAGHTGLGQITNAIASAGLANLLGPVDEPAPSIQAIATYYASAARVALMEVRRNRPQDNSAIEGVVFGWERDRAHAYGFQTIIAADQSVSTEFAPLDFDRFPVHTVGQGHGVAQRHIEAMAAAGQMATLYSTLQAVIDDESIFGVGGNIQAAWASVDGVQLQPVLHVDSGGRAEGGFFGIDSNELGSVGNFFPMSVRPVVIPG